VLALAGQIAVMQRVPGIFLRFGNRLHRRQALCDQTCDAGREGAAGAVVACGQPVPVVGFQAAPVMIEPVADCRRGFVRAGDQHIAAALVEQGQAALVQIVEPGQLAGFLAVRRQDGRAGKQEIDNRSEQLPVRHRRAAAGREHRIEHDRNLRMFQQYRMNRRGGFMMADQADLEGFDVQVREHRIRLADDVFGMLRQQFFDVAGVLLGQRGDHAGGMAAVADQGFDIGLHAGPAARVMAGKAEDDRAGDRHDDGLKAKTEWPILTRKILSSEDSWYSVASIPWRVIADSKALLPRFLTELTDSVFFDR